MGTGSSPGVKSGRGVTLTPHLHLVPWLRKSRAKPLLPLWAVWPVQSLSSCTRVTLPLHSRWVQIGFVYGQMPVRKVKGSVLNELVENKLT